MAKSSADSRKLLLDLLKGMHSQGTDASNPDKTDGKDNTDKLYFGDELDADGNTNDKLEARLAWINLPPGEDLKDIIWLFRARGARREGISTKTYVNSYSFVVTNVCEDQGLLESLEAAFSNAVQESRKMRIISGPDMDFETEEFQKYITVWEVEINA